MVELKPCPFCYRKSTERPELRESRDYEGYDGYSAYYVECTRCHARTSYHTTRNNAILAWNYRDGDL